MGDVLRMPVDTTVDIPVETVCDAAKQCQSVLIIGTDSDGKPYFASSYSDKYRMLYAVEMFKKKLLRGDFER